MQGFLGAKLRRLAARNQGKRQSERKWKDVHGLLLSALAVAGHAAATLVVASRGVSTAGDLLQQPGVRRDAGLLGGGVDDGLQGLRQSQGDARRELFEARRSGRARVRDVDDLGRPRVPG